MGIYLVATDFEKLFTDLDSPPIMANDLDVTTREGKQRFNELIKKKFEGDTLELVPKCFCGQLSGGDILGVVCQNCFTPVEDSGDTSLTSKIWMQTADNVRGFIHPVIYNQLSKVLTQNGVNLLEYLINTSYQPNKITKGMQTIEKHGIHRGLNNFIDNFDSIFTVLASASCMGNPAGRRNMVEMVRMYRHVIFTRYLPIPARIAFITEHTVSGIYADNTMNPALDAIQTCSADARAISRPLQHVVENRISKISKLMAEYYAATFTEIIGKKPGDLRKTVYGGRADFSFRGVIDSLTGIHRPDEIHLPWPMAMSLFQLHLKNKLFRKGFTPIKAEVFLKQHIFKRHPIIEDMFAEILSEPGEKHGGYPCIFQRNQQTLI